MSTLKSELDKLETECFALFGSMLKLKEENIKLKALCTDFQNKYHTALNEIRSARTVIEFYANRENWHHEFGGKPKVIDDPDNAQLGEFMIGGKLGREWLAKNGKVKNEF